jgi:hydroxymethylpyrimidine/phosphomethylpyrimidine kinase
VRSLLLLSGLDPSGGAGFLADVRIAELHGTRPVGAITALTEQTTVGVTAVHPVDPAVLDGQLVGLLTDVEVHAVKIGMLGSQAVAEVVAERLALTAAPAVWDPVLRATSGTVPLYDGEPRRAAELLARHVALMTPNLAEAAALTDEPVDDPAAMARAARDLASDFGCAVLVKGGHLEDRAVDVLCQGDEILELEGERIPLTGPVHGTGCALSTAIACRLALGMAMADAVRAAVTLVRLRLAGPVRAGRGYASIV